MALFRVKFACIFAISNLVFRWKSCKGSVWESVKKCSRLCKDVETHRWLTTGKPPKLAHMWSMQGSWRVMQAVALQDKSPRLARPLAYGSTQSRGQVARTLCLGKTDFSHSFLPYYIYILIPTIFRELPERILREKP